MGAEEPARAARRDLAPAAAPPAGPPGAVRGARQAGAPHPVRAPNDQRPGRGARRPGFRFCTAAGRDEASRRRAADWPLAQRRGAAARAARRAGRLRKRPALRSRSRNRLEAGTDRLLFARPRGLAAEGARAGRRREPHFAPLAAPARGRARVQPPPAGHARGAPEPAGGAHPAGRGRARGGAAELQPGAALGSARAAAGAHAACASGAQCAPPQDTRQPGRLPWSVHRAG
eukprot:scaffold25317_cov82-Phaeocystis_antarctica.AAC.3